MKKKNHIKVAREIVGQCWCDKNTSGCVMNPDLAESFAKRLAVWIKSYEEAENSAVFYRNIIDKCLGYFGKESFVSDNRSIIQDHIRSKLPKLISKFIKN